MEVALSLAEYVVPGSVEVALGSSLTEVVASGSAEVVPVGQRLWLRVWRMHAQIRP